MLASRQGCMPFFMRRIDVVSNLFNRHSAQEYWQYWPNFLIVLKTESSSTLLTLVLSRLRHAVRITWGTL